MKVDLILQDLKIGCFFLNSTRHLNPDQNITEFGGEILLDH